MTADNDPLMLALRRQADELANLRELIRPLVFAEAPAFGIGARVRRTTNQAIANTTTTVITFDAERFDTDNIFNPGSSGRLTCQRAGKYLVIGNVEWQASAGGARRITQIRLNAATIIADVETSADDGGTTYAQNLTTIWDLAAGDFVELLVYQDSGGSLNITMAAGYSPEFMVWRLP